jgi:two-component system sensor histidine kinase KdpD
MTDDEGRPEPEALLAEARKEGRGKLKVFLGAAPGVGKTYAMLETARQRKAEGVDVVAALVETHGRPETEALLAGLEVLLRRQVPYRGRVLYEMDLEAVLKRRPELAVVDELAHTNVPGSLHVKRWQDVEEILAAGIDVYTTLNIQHLESLNDIVARISGVQVRETIPDKVLELADEIELIDLPPEELIERLRQGKVYVTEQIARAIQNFFSKGNLTALRELALRVAADRVDAQMTAHMKAHAIAGPWPTQERILVCVNESPVAQTLVRTAKRMAERARVSWLAVSVTTPGHQTLPEAEKDRTAETLRLAESLGAEIVTLNVESDVASELLDFARARNVSRIVVGRPRRRRFLALLSRETVAERIIEQATDFEVTLVSPDPDLARKATIHGPRLHPEQDWKAYVWTIVAVAAAFALSFAVDFVFPTAALALIFLTAVLVIASRFGLWPSLLASVLSFLIYNAFFTEPRFTLSITSQEDVLTLFLFLLVAVVTGNLAARLRAHALAQRADARRTSNLYEFSRKIASAATRDDVVWAAVHHVAATLQCSSIILVPSAGSDRLEIVGGYPPEDQLDAKDWGAAEWAWKRGEPAGWSSDTLPTASWLFLPLKTAQGRQGLLGISFESRDEIAPAQRRLLDALVDQVALAIERTKLVADLEETRVLSESERLRSALLSSVSHDLRTPLVSIIGSATTLLHADTSLTPVSKRLLTETIREEGERLNRYVQNLLDMTRLGYGALRLNKDWADLREIIGRAIRQLGSALARHQVRVVVPSVMGPVFVDPVLIEQVVANVLDNAAKYAPPGTEITVAADTRGEHVILTIADRGPGIPPKEREQVFDMFYRVRATDEQPAGTGLGLAICRGIVEAHRGRIRADAATADGTGTLIEIELPVGAAAPAVEQAGGAEARGGRSG